MYLFCLKTSIQPEIKKRYTYAQYPKYFGQSGWNAAVLTKLIAQQCIWQYQMSRATFKVFSTCIRGRSQIMFTGIFPLR